MGVKILSVLKVSLMFNMVDFIILIIIRGSYYRLVLLLGYDKGSENIFGPNTKIL